MAKTDLEEPSKLHLVLKAERERQGLSQEWVGDKIGSIRGVKVTKQAVSQWENGVEVPADDTMRAWVLALGQPQDWYERWSVFRETEELKESMIRRNRATRADVEAAIHLLRKIQ